MKLALAIIAKDELELCEKIVSKYGKYFEEIAIAVDQRIDEFKSKFEGKADIYPYEWINDFSHKRNFLAEKIKSEFYLRLDTDDDIENPEGLKELFDFMVSKSFDVLYLPYIYSQDESGNCDAKHWRETIIRKKAGIYWKKQIHENLLIERPAECPIFRSDKVKIIHNMTKEHSVESFKRNFTYLLDEYKRDGEKTDPRTLAYLGRMLMGERNFNHAIIFLEKLVQRSGWNDDKYFAWVQLGQCWQMLGKLDMAISCCYEALSINTKFPDAYLQLGIIYIEKGDFEKAVDWIMPGIVRPEPDTVMVLDPSFYGYKAKLHAAMALLGKGEIEMAWKYFNEAKKASPNNAVVLSKEALFREAFENDKFIKNLLWNVNFIKDRERPKVEKLLESVPKQIYKDERIWRIKNEFSTPKVWGDKEIAIYCGQAWEDWAAPSVLKGIGGSEEAVIYISKELTKLGFKVTVFCSCGEMEGEYEGVEYKPFYMFNPKDKFSSIIAWRGNMLRNISAKKRIIWLHDVPTGIFTEDSINDFDKVIVLSEFHKSLLPEFIPKEKIFVSANGINMPDFMTNGVLRNKKRVIYTSSYDRGLEHTLEIWPEVLKEVPEAELHCFYGWNTYDAMVEKGVRDSRFKNHMTKLMNQPNVFEHGRIGHKQLVKEFQKSGVWAYSSHFEEISCISAMKAQAAGCVPVCTDYAALKETVKAGIKVEGNASDGQTKEKFKEELVKILKDDEGQDVLRAEVLKHKESFGWDMVAKQWAGELLCP